MIVTGYDENGILGYSANLFLVYKTDKNIMFSVDEASINGFMADSFYANSLDGGKCDFSSMLWSDSTFEENDISSVETIKFRLTAKDFDGIFSDYLVDEVITLKP